MIMSCSKEAKFECALSLTDTFWHGWSGLQDASIGSRGLGSKAQCYESPNRFKASAAPMMGMPSKTFSVNRSMSPVMITSTAAETAQASTARSSGSRSAEGAGIGDARTSRATVCTLANAVSGVNSLRASLAANFLRRSTSRSYARSSSLRKIRMCPSATAARTRPGLSPHSSPETRTLLSMTALTPAPLCPHRVNLGLNLFG